MLIWKVLQPAKRGGKRSGRGRTKLKTQHSFSRINAQSAMLCKWWWIVGNIFSYCNFNRNRLWPLNLLSLVLNPFTIYLWTIFPMQTVNKFSPFPEWQKGLVTFGHYSSSKITFELQKQSLQLSERTSISTLYDKWVISELYKTVPCALCINSENC